MQTFEYPNLVAGTRSGAGWNLAGGRPAVVSKSAYMYGPVLPCYNSAATETYLWSAPVTLRADTDYVLSFLAACTGNVRGFDVHVLDTANPSYDGWVGAEMYPALPGGGGRWYSLPFRLSERSHDSASYRIRFDNNGSTDGENSLIWFANVMLCEGTTPRAWAPAAGEVWPE